MAVLSGSITFSKFYVRGELPEGGPEPLVEAISLRAFKPLVAEEEAEERVGWCSVEDPLDNALEHDKVFFNHYINLGLRLDRWRIPAPLFKAAFRQAERETLAANGREKLTRREKDELKFTITRALRRKVLPAMRVVDLSWNTEERVVRFWSQSPSMVAMMTDLFEDTFPVELVPDGIYTGARERGLDPEQLAELPMLEPSRFVMEA